MTSSVTYKADAISSVALDGTITLIASPVKQSATYYTGTRGEEKARYSQSYYNGAIDKTTLYTYDTNDAVLTQTDTYKDLTERTTGAIPLASALGKKTQSTFFKGSEGQELSNPVTILRHRKDSNHATHNRLARISAGPGRCLHVSG